MCCRLVLFPVTLGDPNYPKPPHFQHFASPYLRIVELENRYFKFGTHAGLTVASASPRMANHPWKGLG